MGGCKSRGVEMLSGSGYGVVKMGRNEGWGCCVEVGVVWLEWLEVGGGDVVWKWG